MADEADMSDKRIEDAILHGIDNARIEANKPKIYHTECNWCGDFTEAGARYCCGDCANDHARFNAARERNGRG